jgi:hypothetical protein
MSNEIQTFSHRGQYQAKLAFKGFYCVYYPKEKVETNEVCKTIIWSNGTFAIPWIYHGLLKHLASWGYVVIASWSPFTQIDQAWFKDGVKKAAKLNEHDQTFKGLLDTENLGVSGHSQGGGVALQLARLAQVKASVAIQPSPFSCKKVKSPLLILTGGLDVLVWHFLVFFICFLSATKTVFLLKHKRAGHLRPLGNAGIMRAPTCAFFEWHLNGNALAKQCFNDHKNNFPSSQHWELQQRNTSETKTLIP